MYCYISVAARAPASTRDDQHCCLSALSPAAALCDQSAERERPPHDTAGKDKFEKKKKEKKTKKRGKTLQKATYTHRERVLATLTLCCSVCVLHKESTVVRTHNISLLCRYSAYHDGTHTIFLLMVDGRENDFFFYFNFFFFLNF